MRAVSILSLIVVIIASALTFSDIQLVSNSIATILLYVSLIVFIISTVLFSFRE